MNLTCDAIVFKKRSRFFWCVSVPRPCKWFSMPPGEPRWAQGPNTRGSTASVRTASPRAALSKYMGNICQRRDTLKKEKHNEKKKVQPRVHTPIFVFESPSDRWKERPYRPGCVWREQEGRGSWLFGFISALRNHSAPWCST